MVQGLGQVGYRVWGFRVLGFFCRGCIGTTLQVLGMT